MARPLEASGLPPMASRVFGLLLLAEPPYLDFFAIAEALGASRSAISNALKTLGARRGLVDYRTFPGNRRRYFYIDFERWMSVTKERVAATGEFGEVLERVLALRDPKRDRAFDAELHAMRSFYRQLTRQLRDALAAWPPTPTPRGRDTYSPPSPHSPHPN